MWGRKAPSSGAPRASVIFISPRLHDECTDPKGLWEIRRYGSLHRNLPFEDFTGANKQPVIHRTIITYFVLAKNKISSLLCINANGNNGTDHRCARQGAPAANGSCDGTFSFYYALMNNPPPIVHVAQRSPGIHQKRNLTQVTFI